jgi:signal transduction histidine kinase
MKKWWLWPLLTLAVGLAASAVLYWAANDPFVFMRGSSSTAVLLLAVLISPVVAGVAWWRERRLREVEGQLLQYRAEAAEDRRRFLQRLDHELKNPITAMRAGLANVSGAALEPGQQRALTSIEAQTVRLSRLTADLRKIAELETRTVERVPINLAQLLAEVIEFAEDYPDREGRQVKLTVPNAPWPLPTLFGDRDLLFVAVYNLVENALKFTEPDDTIELRAREDGRFVIVEVADTGPGIAAEEQAHVWEELYRGTNGRGIPGSGLGLSLVKAVVERHDGHVVLTSRPGKGTLVSIHLPVS